MSKKNKWMKKLLSRIKKNLINSHGNPMNSKSSITKIGKKVGIPIRRAVSRFLKNKKEGDSIEENFRKYIEAKKRWKK